MKPSIVVILISCTPSVAWVSPRQTPVSWNAITKPKTSNRLLPHTHASTVSQRSHHYMPIIAAPTKQSLRTSMSIAGEITLEHLTILELKDQLRERGLKVSGTKTELLERLSREHDLNQGQSHSDDSNGVVELKSSANSANVSDELQQLPKIIMDEFIKYTTNDGAQEPQLLPIQRKSFEHIANGGDTVLFSPTGTGKTLAYILPLAARLLEWKRDGSLASKKSRKRTPGNKNDSVSEQVEPATPSILVMEPSRELARQVGKVWTRFHPTAAKNSKKHVVTVYGGVPMARHAAQLNSKTDVVVGTPGRIKELIREKYLSTENLKSIVLDEADTLLNFKDVPEIEWLLDGMQNDYQLVLASATINERVHIFVDEIMEISVGEEGYIVSNGVNEDKEQSHFTELDSIESEVSDDEQRAIVSQPEVRHWSMAASASSRVALTADLILTMEPRRGIIFAASKAEVEVVAGQLSERLSADHSIHVLHGDMIQQARSRAVAAFKGEQTPDSPSSRITRILVATDVASRGLDVPSCDLVLQFGVPRQSGKDGTFDSELYIHRSGRAGRFGNTRQHADAILFYDSSAGERATLSKLQQEMMRLKGVEIMPRPLPSPREVMDASYERALSRCEDFGNDSKDLVQYFKNRLAEDGLSNVEADSESYLVHKLACALAALSGLPAAVRPRSLLTADARDRTIRVWTESGSPLTPNEVTNAVKGMGSGKLGRVSICKDGSAVFDLSAKKAEVLLQTAKEDKGCLESGWHFELPDILAAI